MLLNIVEIAKDVFRDKETIIVEDLSDARVKIWYRNKRKFRKIGASDPRPFVMPKFIELDVELAEAIGLYLGDGKTTQNDSQHLDFSSKDSDILHFMVTFFAKRLLVNLSNMTITIRYKCGEKDKILKKWSKLLSIPKDKFKITFQPRNRYETVSIQINSSILKKIFLKIIDVSLKVIRNDQNLRKGFLRGYFAAEGTIGYNSRENYINYVGFAYNPQNEGWLRNYCISCLQKEGICCSFKERSRNRGEIIISGWNNYWNLWRIRMFDRCLRKKNNFFMILASRKFYCILDDCFRESFFTSLKFNQKQIADIIKSYQGNVSRTVKGVHLLTTGQIAKLLPYTTLSLEDFVQKTIAVKIGKAKIKDKYFIRHIFRLALYATLKTHDSLFSQEHIYQK